MHVYVCRGLSLFMPCIIQQSENVENENKVGCQFFRTKYRGQDACTLSAKCISSAKFTSSAHFGSSKQVDFDID